MSKEIIATHKNIKSVLETHGLAAKKKFGQNFLTDSHVINKIIDASNVTEEDVVIEIGPGIGSLTQFLAERAKHVIAIEIDKDMVMILQNTLSDYENVDIINADILKTDLDEICANYKSQPIKVIANLPYYITTPIIMKCLQSQISMMTIMMQKEVADRMKATPSTKEYGSLSLAVQYKANIQFVANVPPNCFIPRPNVDSAVICLTTKQDYNKPICEEFMFEFIRLAFSKRRKTLVNCLSGAIPLTKEQLADILLSSGFDSRVRGESLSLTDFIKLSDIFYRHIN